MNDDELLRRFLLGELTEDEAEGVEARLLELEEDELFDLCEAVEADLLEETVRGELTPAERDQVLKRLAFSPQGRARLALARDLVAYAGGRTSPKPLPAPLPFPRPAALTRRPAVRWAIAAGLAAILLGGIGGGIWNFVQKNGTGDQGNLAMRIPTPEQDSRRGQGTIPGPAPAPVDPNVGQTDPGATTPERPVQDRDQIPPIPKATEPEPPARAPLIIELSLLTTPRGEGEPEAIQELERIPSGRDIEIRVLDVVTLGGYDSYDAVLKRGDEKIFRFEPRLEGDNLVLDLPASALPAGRYRLEVSGSPAGETPDPLLERELEVSGGG